MNNATAGGAEPQPGAGADSRRLPVILVLGALCAAAGMLSYFKVVSPDAFWHLKTGQVIIEGGRLLHTNLFSCTYPDFPWHNLEWLFQVLLASVYNGFGWGGVMALKIMLVQATTAILYATLIGRARAPLLAAGVLLYVLALMRFRLTERPQLLSFLLFAAVIWVVQRRHRSGRVLWVLPPLFALWSNVHPELILGLAYLGATVVGDALDSVLDTSLPPPALRREVLVLASCGAATLANPEGWRVMLTTFDFAKAPTAPLAIREFRHSTLESGALFWILIGVCTLLFLLQRRLRSWAAILPLAGLAVIGAFYARGTTAFAMAAAPLVHGGLAGLARAEAGRSRRRALGALVFAAAGAALSWTWFFDPNQSYRWGHGPDDAFPAAAANFLLANDLPPNLYNHYTDGGYLIFRLYPRWRVFQDGRGPYPQTFFQAATGSHDLGDIRRLFDQHRVNTALLSRGEVGTLLPVNEWGVVYWDDAYAVLVRRSPASLALLERLEYRVFLPGKPFPQDRDGLLLMVREMRRSQALWSRADWRLSALIGKTLLLLGDPAGAEPAYAQATTLAPNEPEPWAALSAVRRQLGVGGAREAGIARKLDPGGKKIRGILGDE